MHALPHHIAPATGTSIWDIGTAVGTVGATVIALATVLWRGYTQPRLRLHMVTADPPNGDLTNARRNMNLTGPAAKTIPQIQLPAAYVRARIEAIGQAQGAQVVIQSADLRNGDEEPVRLELQGMNLAWSFQERTGELTIPRGVQRHVDIASFTGGFGDGTKQLEMETVTTPNDKRNQVEAGELTLVLALASHNGPSSLYRVVIEFDGEWPKGEEIWGHVKVSQPVRLKGWRAGRA